MPSASRARLAGVMPPAPRLVCVELNPGPFDWSPGLDVLKVKFTHSNTVRDKKPYTIYEIEVRSSSTITWVIYKRYSSFHLLHTELMKAASPEQKIHLPQLPPKRLTRSLAVEFVEKRKTELQDYLRALLETPGLVHSPIILAFLEVPDSVRPMLAAAMQSQSQQAGFPSLGGSSSGGGDGSSKDYADSSSFSANSGAAGSSKLAYASKTPDERRILELINLLRFHPNKVSALKSFEDAFFDARPRLSGDFIKLLLQGKSGSEQDGGLIQTIGDIGYSHVASRAALSLLCRLLDVEKNKDAHLFLDQFTALDAPLLKKMQLSQHIVSERGNRIGAFKIIHIIRNANVAGGGSAAVNGGGASGGPSRLDFQLEQIVPDSWALREYFKWAERRADTSGQIVPFNHAHSHSQNKDNIFKSINLTAGGGSSAAAAAASSAANGGVASSAVGAHGGKGGEGVGGGGSFSDAGDVGQMRFLRARISDIFQDLRRLMEEKDAPIQPVEALHASPPVSAPSSAAASAPPGAPSAWRVVGLVPSFDAHGRPLPLPADSWDQDVSLLYRTRSEGVVTVKMQCIVPYRMEEIAPYLADLRRRKEWDLKFHKGSCLEIRASQEYAPAGGGGGGGGSAQAPAMSLQYPEYQADIAHMVFKSFSSPYKYRDVVVLRCFAQIDKTRQEFEQQGFRQRQTLMPGNPAPASSAAAAASVGASSPYASSEDKGDGNPVLKECEEPLFKEGAFADGGMLFGSRSVIHAAGPEFKDNVRAVLYPTGYVLQPLREQSVDLHHAAHAGGGGHGALGSAHSSCSDMGAACRLTFLSQMDRESVLIVSPDLLGETNELRQTLLNIKLSLERDYGLRTLRRSAHTDELRRMAGRPEHSAAAAAAGAGRGSVSHAPHDGGAALSSSHDASPQQRHASLPIIPEKR